MLKIFITLQILYSVFKCHTDNKILSINTEAEFFQILRTTNFVLTFFHQENFSIENLQKIAVSPIIQDKNIKLLSVLFEQFPSISEFYNLKQNDNKLMFFINRKKVELKNFENLLNTSDFDVLFNFVENNLKIENLIEIKKFGEINELEGNKLFLYVGSKNINFENFIHLSLNNPEVFYYIFDENLKEEISQKYDFKEKKENDMFVILTRKDKSFEKITFLFEGLQVFEELDNFFYFETHPKIRDCNDINEIISLFYKKKYPIVLFNSEPSFIENKIFSNVAEILQKDIFFIKCKLDNQNILNQVFFNNAVLLIEKDQLYVLSFDTENNIKIRKMDNELEFNVFNVANFIIEKEKKITQYVTEEI